MDFRPLSESKPQPLEWFWPGYLAVGSLVVLDGDPGQGKSLVTLDLAARISAGRTWPDGAAIASPAPVLMICSEDVDSVITARLRAAGADLDRVFLWPRHGDARLPSFPSDIPELDLALQRTRARFVVIDPIMSFLDRFVTASNDASVRRALHPLAQLADKHGCVILMVRHLCKSPGGRALYRGAGSIGFVAACRFGWLAAADPFQSDRSILAQTKFNYVARQPSLSYTIRSDTIGSDTIGSDASGRPAPRIDWLGPASWTADELTVRRLMPSRRRARDFLQRFLAAGPRTSAEVWSEARTLGLSRRTIFRAKEELDVRTARSPTGATWFLPEHDLPLRPSETPALDAWLEKWRGLHCRRASEVAPDVAAPDDIEPRRAG